MSSNSNIVQAELLVREGAKNKQAMWIGYRCPVSGKLRTMWGAVQAPSGAGFRVTGHNGLQTTLQFTHNKDAATNASSVSALYSKKRSKYTSVGLCELNIDKQTVSPLRRTSDRQAQAPEPKAPASPSLPKEITHPEAAKSTTSPGARWFF